MKKALVSTFSHLVISELKQTRRRRKRERHLKIAFPQSFFNYSKSLNWNQLLGHKRKKLNICHHILASSTQLQNRSFHVVERTRTSSKCQKVKYARAKRAKILFFIVKYANLWGFCFRRRRDCLISSLAISSDGDFTQCQSNNKEEKYKFPVFATLKHCF